MDPARALVFREQVEPRSRASHTPGRFALKQSLRQMITCHWSAHGLQRYLDADPSAPLTHAETARLEAHLAICERCAQAAQEHRVLRRTLSRWSGAPAPDPEAVQRLHTFVTRLTDEDSR